MTNVKTKGLIHVNEAGQTNVCEATERVCQFSEGNGLANHYTSYQEARNHYEAKMEPQKFPALSKSYEPNAEKVLELEQEAREARSKMYKLEKTLLTAKGKPEALESVRWFEMVQEAKHYKYLSAAKELEAERYMTESERSEKAKARAEKLLQSSENFENWKITQEKKNGPYNFHPDITEANEHDALKTVQAWSGLSADSITALVETEMAAGYSKTEAYRRVWANVPMRKDKPIISIDLEVAGPQGTSYVDNGPYSQIIEIGIVKLNPDGTRENISFLSGISRNFANVYGTGAEHIHNISPDDVRGKKIFTQDPARQAHLIELLEGSVIVAHNAKFEESQLGHNLFGFNKLKRKGLEILDTRKVSEFFLPENETNTNEALVTAAGLKYEKAHRAWNDADMTINALLKLKNEA